MWWRRRRALRDLEQDIQDHIEQESDDSSLGASSPTLAGVATAVSLIALVAVGYPP
jgi:hypothetical protein